MLTQEQLKELLHYCPETGVWTWIVDRGGMRKGDEAGYIHTASKKKYRGIGVFGNLYSAHRLAFLYMTGEFPKHEVDHGDGNGLNNAWTNLSDVTVSRNQMNRRLGTNNTSGAIGVYRTQNGKNWRASIRANGMHKFLGIFANKEDAVAARKKAEAELGFHPNNGTDRPS